MGISRISRVVVLILAVAVAAAPGASGAALQPFKFLGVDTSVSAILGGVYVGGYRGEINGVAYRMFCVDYNHHIAGNETYQTLAALGRVTDASAPDLRPTGTPDGYPDLSQEPNNLWYYENPNDSSQGAGLSSALHDRDYLASNATLPSGTDTAAKRAAAVAWLTDNYVNVWTQSVQVPVQLAIWDIVQYGGNYTLINAIGGSWAASAQSYVQLAFANSANYTGNAIWVQAPRSGEFSWYDHRQEFVYSIPEPVFFQMGALAGMGGLGLLRLRKRERPV
ncbi:MAG: hypothetical protein KatS3mg024_2726 [Armatimonadota bacterium]|nr:MAG: hypothetical protein KatS3mg024_2726 [Armatimonadota bacterium]